MPPIALSKIQHAVSSEVRKRGAQYAHSGAVDLENRTSLDASLEAVVYGTDVYNITLCYEDHALWCDCSCPYFTDRFELCKHIWATLIECVRYQIEFLGTVGDLIANLPADDGLEDDYDESVLRGQVVPLRRGWVAPSRWRDQLRSIGADNWQQHCVVSPPQEITWVLDAASSGTAVSVEITSHTVKKNGELGNPKPVRIDHRAVASIASPLDREILSIAPPNYGYGSIDTKLAIGWPKAEYVIPKLVETGRLLIRTRAGEYEHCSAFDAGEPWRLAVRAEERDGKYILLSTLRRGEKSIPLTDALAVTRGGFVVFRRAIARFADEETSSWAAFLRRDTIELPSAQGGRALLRRRVRLRDPR